MSNIYNITTEYLEIAQKLEQGELTPELEQALAINKDTLEVKAVKYGYVLKSFEDDIEGIDKELKRLQGLKTAKENAIEKIKETVKSAMEIYGITEIKQQNLTVNFRKSTKTIIEDATIIPKKFKKIVTTTTVSLKEVGEALKNGEKVKGAKLQENKNIQFK